MIASLSAKSGKWLEAMQKGQIDSWLGASKDKESKDNTRRRRHPLPVQRYTWEIWVKKLKLVQECMHLLRMTLTVLTLQSTCLIRPILDVLGYTTPRRVICCLSMERRHPQSWVDSRARLGGLQDNQGDLHFDGRSSQIKGTVWG